MFFFEKLVDLVKKKNQAGELLRARRHDFSEPEKVTFGETPVQISKIYKGADKSEHYREFLSRLIKRWDILYEPERLNGYDDPKGKTKKEILKERQSGWQVVLIEDLPMMPDKDKGKTLRGRKQFEAGQWADYYLVSVHALSAYKGEKGMNPETYITYVISRVVEKGEITDDGIRNENHSSLLIGSFFPVTDILNNEPRGPYGETDTVPGVNWGPFFLNFNQASPRSSSTGLGGCARTVIPIL